MLMTCEAATRYFSA